MSIESDIYNALASHASVTAILTDSPPAVYHSVAPDRSRTYIAFEVIGITPANELDGNSAKDRLRVQVDAYAPTRAGAIALAAAARTAMLAGNFSAYFLNKIGPYEDQVQLHRVIQDFSVWTDP